MLTIQQSGRKAAAIVQDLLTLARRGVADFQVVGPQQYRDRLLESPEFEKLIQFHPAVTVTSRLAADLVPVKGSSVHLFKTVMNLVSNAAEAMPDGGTLSIQTANRTVDRSTSNNEIAKEREYAVLIVQDNGTGISKSDMERIFEPLLFQEGHGQERHGSGYGRGLGNSERPRRIYRHP